MRFRIILIMIICSVGLAKADGAFHNDSSSNFPLVHHLEAGLGFDYVAPSVEDEIREKIPKDEKISVRSALPINLKYSISFTDPSIKHYLAGGYQGIGVGVLNLGALEKMGTNHASGYIGYPVLTYVFQGGPFWHIDRNLSLDYEWNFGASFGWKPYSEENKYFNLAVGSRVNAYLNLQLLLKWSLNPNTSIYAGLGVSHFSNGNTSFPNPGINSFGLRAGVIWTINPIKSILPEVEPNTMGKKKINYDLSVWVASRKRVYKGLEQEVLRPGHFICAGVSFAPMWNLNSWWRVGPSADLQWDQSSDMDRNYIGGSTTDDIEFGKPNFFRQVSFGISAHGELRMPIFAVNVGVGYNVFAPHENRGSYQNIALKTYLCESVFLNVGYQLRNFYQQSSLMLGLGLTL